MAKLTENYEIMIVLSLAKGEEAMQQVLDKCTNLMESQATAVEVQEGWGKRKLAYPINDETEAYYVVAKFQAAPEVPKELSRVLGITEGVLRSMITVAA